MSDLWEVQWEAKDPLTEQRIINPVDPTDAYEDPDNDGYDYNHNGYIDRFDDFVVLSKLEIPPASTTTRRTSSASSRTRPFTPTPSSASLASTSWTTAPTPSAAD